LISVPTGRFIGGVGATTGFCLCESKAKRQCQDVGHEGFITGHDATSLRSSTRFAALSSVVLILEKSPCLHSNQLNIWFKFQQNISQLLRIFLLCLWYL